MGYVESILQPNETVLRTGKTHWIIYIPGLAVLLLGFSFLITPAPDPFATGLRILGTLCTVAALVMLCRCWVEQVTTEIAVINRRVIQKRGWIRRRTDEMNMDKVESVQVDQTVMGRILNYGSVSIRGTGSGIDTLHHINEPLALRSAIVVR